MDFGTNKTPAEIIKEDAFGRTYFRDIYSSINGKWYRKSWEEFNEFKKYYCSSYYDVSVNKYSIKCGTSLRVWDNKGWIHSVNPCGWFQWYFRYWLGRRSVDDQRQINRWKGIVTRFKGKLMKMSKDVGGKFDGCSILPKIRQIQ